MNRRISLIDKKINLSAFAVLVLVLVFTVSCGSDISVSKAKKKKKAGAGVAATTSIVAKAAPVLEKDYVYTSIGKRDPFRSIFDDFGGEAAVAQEERIISQLQNYDVNTFTVNGIIWGVSSPTAMVSAPDGKSYIVKNGTLIGRNWGKVVKIKRDSIVILEQSPLPNGTKVSNLIELKIPVKTIKPTEQASGWDTSEFEENSTGDQKGNFDFP